MTFSENLNSVSAVSGSSSARSVLQAVLETTREGVLIVEGSTRISAANRAAGKAFAWQDGTLIGKRLSEVIRNPALHEGFQKSVQFGTSSDIRIELTDPEKHIFDVHIAPIEMDGRRYAVGVFYDVTQIERLERVRQEFLSNISHELRTPLTSIMAFVETLEDGAIDDKDNNRRFLGVIRRNAERMHVLISDILELSSIESGNIALECKYVNVPNLVNEIFSSLASSAAARNISLNTEMENGARVFADPARLDQMLTNLIDNAIKFNRDNGRVTVRLVRREKTDVLFVVDSGEGISPEHLQRIFERFYRADRSRAREVGGTGLGLAIVKHLARLHGGEISVKSALGSGAAFSIELPAS